MKPQILDMDSEVLAEFKNSMNYAIKTVIDQLTAKGLTAGEVTGKIRIRVGVHTDKETGEIYYMPELEPDVNLKIGSSGKMDCDKQAGMILKKSPCGMPVVSSSQISIDELMDAEKGA